MLVEHIVAEVGLLQQLLDFLVIIDGSFVFTFVDVFELAQFVWHWIPRDFFAERVVNDHLVVLLPLLLRLR